MVSQPLKTLHITTYHHYFEKYKLLSQRRTYNKCEKFTYTTGRRKLNFPGLKD